MHALLRVYAYGLAHPQIYKSALVLGTQVCKRVDLVLTKCKCTFRCIKI
jgi:hypothetical protein